MRFQVTLRLFLLAFMLAKVKTKQYPLTSLPSSKRCMECEEEVWEEIPCDEIETTTLPPIPITTPAIIPTTLPPSTKIPTITTPTPVTTTTTPSTTTTTTTYAPYVPSTYKPKIYASKRYPLTSTTTTTTEAPTTTPSIESGDGYKKCYCECKSGCKEFCRKVVVYPDAKKQITQLSKTTQPLEYGQMEVKHLLERNWIPSPSAYTPNNIPVHQPQTYYQNSNSVRVSDQALPPEQLPQLAYINDVANAGPSNSAAPYGSTNYLQHSEVDSLGISFEELKKLLHSDHNYDSIIPQILQPPNDYQNLYANQFGISLNQAENSYQNSVPNGIVGEPVAAPPAPISEDYKTSIEKSYPKPEALNPYLTEKPAVGTALPAPHNAPSPCAEKHADSSSADSSLPAEDAGLDGYFKNLIYSRQPKAHNFGYSLSF